MIYYFQPNDWWKMQKLIGASFALTLFSSVVVNAACPAYTYTFSNGSTADANQVNANFNTVLNCANTLAPIANPLLTGNVGVGVSTSYALLDLGTAISTIKLSLFNNSGSNAYGIGVNSGQLTFGAALSSMTATPQMVLTNSGYLGIGTTSPSYSLYVAGTAYASGAAGALSDIRHKDNVRTLFPGAVVIVERLRPVTFTWKDPRDDGMKGEQIGFIAQEVQKILPSVVMTENNKEKTMGIKYTEIIPVLTKAIQEQQAEIQELRAEVVALKSAK